MNSEINMNKVAAQLLQDFSKEHYEAVAWKVKATELIEENENLKKQLEEKKGTKENGKA